MANSAEGSRADVELASVVSRSYAGASAAPAGSVASSRGFGLGVRSALAGLALLVLGASGCGGSASPSPTVSPSSSPTAVAATATPTIDGNYTPVVPKPSPTPRPSPTPAPTFQPIPTPTRYSTPTPWPTVTPWPTATPTPTPLPTPSLEERVGEVKALIQKLSGSNETIKGYNTIKPIVDAVIGPTGIKYDNLTVTILPYETFNLEVCKVLKQPPNCRLDNINTAAAFVENRDVFVREGRSYQVIMVTLREVLAAASYYNSYPYNHGNSISWSLSDDEIAGNLGWVAANATLAERFGYDPHNDIADTPENRAFLNRTGFGDSSAGDWLRAAWLIPEDLGFLDRNKPEQRVTAEEAWKAYTHFYNQQDPDGYAQKLLSSHDRAKDSEWARQVMLLRLKPGKQPTELDNIIITQYSFHLP